MNKFFLATCALAVLLLASCNKQPKATDGQVLFSVKGDFLKNLPAGENPADIGIKISFNEKFLRVEEIKQQMGQQFTLFDRQKKIETTFLSMPAGKYAISTGKAADTLAVEQLPETKKIAGFTCKKATIKLGDQPIEVFYTEELGVDFCPFGQMKGFVMEYSLPMPMANNEKLVFSADKVDLKKIPDSLFVAPKGYEPITPLALQQKMSSGAATGTSPQLSEGASLNPFTVDDMSGNKISLADLQGKVVVLNFWFIACKPCQMEMPQLNDLVKKYANNKDVIFLAVTFDQKQAVEKYLQKNTFNYRQIADARQLIEDVQVMAFPTNVVLDKQGKVVGSKAGYSDEIGKELTTYIDKALK